MTWKEQAERYAALMRSYSYVRYLEVTGWDVREPSHRLALRMEKIAYRFALSLTDTNRHYLN